MPTFAAQRPSYPNRGGPYDHTTAGMSSKGHTWHSGFTRTHRHTHTAHRNTPSHGYQHM